MKRYKLIKPLPMHEVGDEGFYIDSDGNLMHRATYAGETVYPAPVLARHPNILTDWFEEILERPKTVDDLEGNAKCWVIGIDSVYHMEWDKIPYAVEKRVVGEIVMTEEEGLKKITRRKAEVILRRDTKGFKPKYNLDEKRYYVSYDPTEKELWYGYEDYSNVSHDIVFASVEDAEASIKAHPNEWKTYLGVEE